MNDLTCLFRPRSIAELDLNPLMALPAGHGAVVVDARIRLAVRAQSARR